MNLQNRWRQGRRHRAHMDLYKDVLISREGRTPGAMCSQRVL